MSISINMSMSINMSISINICMVINIAKTINIYMYIHINSKKSTYQARTTLKTVVRAPWVFSGW